MTLPANSLHKALNCLTVILSWCCEIIINIQKYLTSWTGATVQGFIFPFVTDKSVHVEEQKVKKTKCKSMH